MRTASGLLPNRKRRQPQPPLVAPCLTGGLANLAQHFPRTIRPTSRAIADCLPQQAQLPFGLPLLDQLSARDCQGDLVMSFDMAKPDLVEIHHVGPARSSAMLMDAPDEVSRDAHIHPASIWFATSRAPKESQAPHQVRGDGDGRTEISVRQRLGVRSPPHTPKHTLDPTHPPRR